MPDANNSSSISTYNSVTEGLVGKVSTAEDKLRKDVADMDETEMSNMLSLEAETQSLVLLVQTTANISKSLDNANETVNNDIK